MQIGLVVAGAAACCVAIAIIVAQHAAPTPRTVDWYVAHAAERGAMRETCRNEPGNFRLMADCQAVKHADMREDSQSLDAAR